MGRERLQSRLGFILISAGCAIGIGNVWKFPYMAGRYGGGIFVLIYLMFLLFMGVPAMTMEFTLGRASQQSPIKMFKKLEPEGTKWHLHGYACLIGSYLLMMFYTVVTGWMLSYFVSMASGSFVGLDTAQVTEQFGALTANPGKMTLYTALTIATGFAICSTGVAKGIEKVTKVMMLALLAIMAILAVNSLFMDGAKEGLTFYLKPDMDKFMSVGPFNVIVGAMNQAFFTLSIGMGSMAIFGSYIGKDRALMGESVNIALLDTFVAITSGLIIFPACFTFGVDAGSGPSLVFITLPNIFNNIPFGRFWGSLFFVFMTFAAFSTVIAVFENIISCCMEQFNWSRKKTCAINLILMFVLCIPCVLGFNLWSGFMPFGEGSNIMDLEDFAVSNVILPVGAIIFVVFSVTRYGFGWDKFVEEANTGKGLKVQKWMRGYFTYVLPVIIAALFITGIVQKFFIK